MANAQQRRAFWSGGPDRQRRWLRKSSALSGNNEKRPSSVSGLSGSRNEKPGNWNRLKRVDPPGG